jgi:hypothetical protein
MEFHMPYLGQTLVFAVAQRSFENYGNWFSTLVPLATLDGEIVDREEFPNRGLAWWMVRGVADVIRSGPGRLITAIVEEAVRQDDPREGSLPSQLRFSSGGRPQASD